MSENIKNRILDEFRFENCSAEDCAECDKKPWCMLYAFFSATTKNRTNIEIAVELLENHGFHVTDANEERAVPTENGHVIDECGIKPTGAILIRAVPVTPSAA